MKYYYPHFISNSSFPYHISDVTDIFETFILDVVFGCSTIFVFIVGRLNLYIVLPL